MKPKSIWKCWPGRVFGIYKSSGGSGGTGIGSGILGVVDLSGGRPCLCLRVRCLCLSSWLGPLLCL